MEQKGRAIRIKTDQRTVLLALTIFGAEGDSMKPYHVKMQAFGVHRVAAEQARHSAG
jgi:hypothetical protein